ncbi:MAG TPA: hypothetical protein VE398_16520 [Acidobacteriota bacterium]|nr:hypothetical protein [Acidobacteriota bacterium]
MFGRKLEVDFVDFAFPAFIFDAQIRKRDLSVYDPETVFPGELLLTAAILLGEIDLALARGR